MEGKTNSHFWKTTPLFCLGKLAPGKGPTYTNKRKLGTRSELDSLVFIYWESLLPAENARQASKDGLNGSFLFWPFSPLSSPL